MYGLENSSLTILVYSIINNRHRNLQNLTNKYYTEDRLQTNLIATKSGVSVSS